VARARPATASGVRAAGDPDRPIRRVAVCGGAGDDRELLAAVRAAGVDAYVTADLRHHPASEAMEDARFGGGPALVDVAHFASEWPWLPVAAGLLAGGTVETRVSTIVTDPWTAHTC
jgi:putative NIF3 family GTP cyclohydrolase 1 type 2